MRQLMWGLKRASWLYLLVMLAACGGPGTDIGAPPLTDNDFVFSAIGTVPAGAYDSGTRVAIWGLTRITEEGSHYIQLYEDNWFTLDAAGKFTIEIDARKIAPDSAPIKPIAFAEWMLPTPRDGIDSREIRSSEPEAELRLWRSIGINQSDPATGGRGVYSHWGYFLVEDSSATVVFSDRAFTLSATLNRPGLSSHEIKATLAPGWNLIYSDYNSERLTRTYMARKLQTDDLVEFFNNDVLLGWPDDVGVYAYSVVAQHQVTEASVSTLGYDWGWGSNVFVNANSWLGFSSDANSPLLPFADTVIGNAFTGTVTSDEPGARGVRARILAYDAAAVESPDWWSNPDLSYGTLFLQSDQGNPVLHIYSDRSTTLHVLGTVPSIEGVTTWKTQDLGLDLHPGWNSIEVRPSVNDADTFILVEYEGYPRHGEVK